VIETSRYSRPAPLHMIEIACPSRLGDHSLGRSDSARAPNIRGKAGINGTGDRTGETNVERANAANSA
jgi:hypothetical protein